MRNRNRPGWKLTLTCRAGFLGRSAAAPQVVGKAQEESKAIKAMVEETVGWYQVFSDASAPEAMAPQARLALAERNTRDARIGRRVRLVGPRGASRGFGKHLPV